MDRRPIAARRLGVFREVSSWLAARNVSPNLISVAGMVAGMLAGVCFAMTPLMPSGERALWAGGAALVLGRLLCNMLDGMVAIERGIASKLGELFNEIPDRVSDAATLIGFGFACGGDPFLGGVAAALAVFVAYVRAMGAITTGLNDFRGPMAKQQRMFLVIVSALFLAAAPFSWRPEVAVWDHRLGLPSLVLVVICIGCVLTSLRRVSGTVRALGEGEHD